MTEVLYLTDHKLLLFFPFYKVPVYTEHSGTHVTNNVQYQWW